MSNKNNQAEGMLETNGFEVYDVTSKSRAAFTVSKESVFREDVEDTPRTIGSSNLQYMAWGRDNQMPYNIIDVIEGDETLTACMQFNSEICYGGGIEFDCMGASESVKKEVEFFTRRNSLSSYFLGICQDLKYFGFAVSVLYLNDNGKIVRVLRKHAAYCRFAPKDNKGNIPYVLYGNWRNSITSADDLEKIELLDPNFTIDDMMERLGKEPSRSDKKNTRLKKFAIVTSIPTADSTYYPIPPYASLFKGKWFNIKTLVGVAKEASLQNSSPIKYLVEISQKYFEGIIKRKGVTDKVEKRKVINEEKAKIVEYLTGVENTNKALFANYYVTPDGKEMHEVKITSIDSGKTQGGDWSADMAEAVNMICFAMRVHSNLVGSLPSKAQMNNSGSDKRELYTIAQALQKPYRDIFFNVPNAIIECNVWEGVFPKCPFIQLTTLDENRDAKEVTLENKE